MPPQNPAILYGRATHFSIIIQEAANHMKSIHQQLSQGTHIITGIIEVYGSSRTKNDDETHWTLLTAFEAWRDLTGNIQNDLLFLMREDLTEQELHDKLDRLQALQIVTVKILVGTANRATILEIIDDDVQSDDDLNAIVAKRKRPLTITDGLFGEFELDEYMDWYEGIITWGALQVKIYVSDDESARQHEFAVLKQLWTKLDEYDRLFKDAIAIELLASKNNAWLSDNETALTAEEFKERLQLHSLQVAPNGDYKLSFDDGDLFWGHWIIVSGNIISGIDKISVAG